MDYLDTSKPGGYPFYIGKQIGFLQDVWRDHINALTAIIPDYTNKVAILQGCEKSEDGANFNVAAGVMLFKGELCLVEAHTVPTSGPQSWYVEESADATLDPKTMADGSQANVHKRRLCKASNSSPSGFVLESAVLDMRTTDWVVVDTEFGDDFSVNGTPGDFGPLQYRKRSGYIEIEGTCLKDVDNSAARTILTLPSGYRPSKAAHGTALHSASLPLISSGAIKPIQVGVDGVVAVSGISGALDTVYVSARVPMW